MRNKLELHNEELRINGKDYTVTGTFFLETESNYGADADGNRGIEIQYIDDYEIESLLVGDVDVTDDLMGNDVENVVEWMEDHIGRFV